MAALGIEAGDVLRADFATGEVVNVTKNLTAAGRPFSGVQRDIYLAGDLFAYGATLGK
jgi:hypothetical protein